MSSTVTTTMTTTFRPTSLSDSGIQLSSDSNELKSPETLSSLASPLLSETEDNARAKSRMEKYFAEKPDKNIFMKIIHPSYHERNLQFKKIFVEKGLIEETDQFLASYSCAYQREILAQGRMFISQLNVCFYANIIGWETTLVIPMKEIKLIKKTKAAFIFPNSIQIERPTIKNENEIVEKYFFASFINRDKSFQVLTTAHQKVTSEEGRPMTREEVWDMVYNGEDKNSQNQTPSDGGTPSPSKNRSTENMTNLNSQLLNGSISSHTEASVMKSDEKDNTSQSSTSSDFHDDDSAGNFSMQSEQEDDVIGEVPCPCPDHSGRLLMDKEIKLSFDKFYELLFTDSTFLNELHERVKTTNYVAGSWLRDHQGETTRTCTYKVAVSQPLSKKIINVNEKQVLIRFPNPKQGLVMMKETQNSGVPMSDCFIVNCQMCISRTGPSSCRVKVHASIHFLKETYSIVRTMIEKGTNKGLSDHYDALEKMIEEYISKHPDEEDRRVSPTVQLPEGTTTSKLTDNHSNSSNNIRPRKPQKASATDRLLAGGELGKGANNGGFEAAMRPRNTLGSESLNRPSLSAASSEYTPFLIAIIVLLALFFSANLYVLNGFRQESTVASSRSEQELSDMLSKLMEQVKELKEKVEQIQK